MKIVQENYITKEIIDAFPFKKNIDLDLFLFICQPTLDILSIIIQMSTILEYLEFDIIFIPEETYEIMDFLSNKDF